MLLTPSELDSLTRLIHRSPHTLLGLHPLGDGTGLVGRPRIVMAVDPLAGDRGEQCTRR